VFLETKTDGETTVVPSFQGFIEFVKTKDPNEEYLWRLGSGCAAGQYAKSLGMLKDFLSRGCWGETERAVLWAKLSCIAQPAYPDEYQTFGALLKKLENSHVS
jgi:hypothetical protein